MNYVSAFIVCGILCVIAQIIYDNTTLTPGHITSLYVVLGALLDSFGFYDRLITFAGGGALVPITSFGHSLIHGALASAKEYGVMGIFMGMFDITATGITASILISFVIALIFKPQE